MTHHSIQERKALEAYEYEIKDYYSEEIGRLDLIDCSYDENWVINMDNMYAGYEYDTKES